jgi:hypothetical protein
MSSGRPHDVDSTAVDCAHHKKIQHPSGRKLIRHSTAFLVRSCFSCGQFVEAIRGRTCVRQWHVSSSATRQVSDQCAIDEIGPARVVKRRSSQSGSLSMALQTVPHTTMGMVSIEQLTSAISAQRSLLRRRALTQQHFCCTPSNGHRQSTPGQPAVRAAAATACGYTT